MRITIPLAARGQLVRLVILTASGLALSTFVRWPTWKLPLILLDSPLTLELTGQWVVAGVLGLLVGTGTDVLVRFGAKRTAAPVMETVRCWILPGLMAAVAALLIPKLTPWTTAWWAALSGVALGIGAVGWMFLRRAGETPSRSGLIELGLTVTTYGLALLVFTAVYAARVRTALSGSAVGVTAALLAIGLFSSTQPLNRRIIASGGGVGLMLIAATWVLNHRPMPAAVGGVLLALLFYGLTTVVHAHQQGQLTPRTVVELVVVATVVVGLITGLGLR